MSLSDGLVRLRPWSLDDVDWVTDGCQDPEIARWTRIPSPYRRADAIEFIEGARALVDEPTEVPFAVELVDDPRPGVGSISLMAMSGPEAEAGYWVAPSARGRGVAGRALVLLVRHAFDQLGLDRVWLQVLEGNTASERVASAAGFTVVETRPAEDCGEPGDQVTVFERLREVVTART